MVKSDPRNVKATARSQKEQRERGRGSVVVEEGRREREGHTGGHLVSWTEWDVDTIVGAVLFKKCLCAQDGVYA